MSLWSTLLGPLLPLIEPLAKDGAQALARELGKRRDAPYRKHYYAPLEPVYDQRGDVIERRTDTSCAYCGRYDPKRRLFTRPPCTGPDT
jgi:hypothetical protein